MELANQNPDVLKLYTKVIEQDFLFQEQRVLDLSLLNATERYLKLQKEISNIENILPQYHIASYLNITPVQLSRIRKDLVSKK